MLTGFSVFSCLILLLAYLFFLPDMKKSLGGKMACLALLLSLAALQLSHSLYFASGEPLLAHREYGLLLTIIPAFFYFFSRSILFASHPPPFTWQDGLHALPSALALLMPVTFLPALAFTFGTAYTLWFARVVLKLRAQTKRFKFELFFFGLFAVMAICALTLGLLLPKLDHAVFYTAYANAIAVALLMIVSALIFFPELLSDILLASQMAYSNSTLKGVDTPIKLVELDKLMTLDKQFQNEDLSLSTLAELLNLSAHQLSELINGHFSVGFPRYVREQRVNEAKRLLLIDDKVSILAISMETGFRSQSSFYTAFKEITGLSPGQFRKTAGRP